LRPELDPTTIAFLQHAIYNKNAGDFIGAPTQDDWQQSMDNRPFIGPMPYEYPQEDGQGFTEQTSNKPYKAGKSDSEQRTSKNNSNNPSLSFGEAFKQARKEKGDGGVFEWRGKKYTTNIKGSGSKSTSKKYTTTNTPSPAKQEVSSEPVRKIFMDPKNPNVVIPMDDIWNNPNGSNNPNPQRPTSWKEDGVKPYEQKKTIYDYPWNPKPTTLQNGGYTDGQEMDLTDAEIQDVRTKRKNPVNGNDLTTPSLFWQRGYIYLYSYGIPYFLVESDINVDYRHGQNNLEKDFYPHNGNLDEWLQEKNVPIKEDNFYFYNKTYSKQNKESVICNNKADFEPGKECRINHPNRVITSQSQDYGTNNYDNWRVFKANSFDDFPLSDGKLISVDGIESDKVLVRLENMSRVFNAYNLIPTDQESIQVETGGMFKTRAKEFVVATLGYAGTQHRTLLSTEYGHIFVDAKRGNVFNLGNGGSSLDELSKDGMKNWFKENLPFQILKDFPTLTQEELDNNYKGLGLILAYDRRFHRFMLTKLDYKSLNSNVKYNSDTKTFYILNGQTPIDVSLDDPRYFCNKSWTISYNFFTKSWVSFHSFKPLYYNYFVDTFECGIQGSLWSHNVTNKSYQVYFGTLYPFIIEYITNQSVTNNELTSVEYSCEAIRHHNEYDSFYNRLVTFNKAIIYNERQCSGLLELVPRDENDMRQIVNFPEYKPDRTRVLVTNSENIWKFNNFNNLVNSDINNVPLFLHNCTNDYKELNPSAFNYYKNDLSRGRIRNKQCKVRLINDIHSNYHFMFNFAQTNQIRSFR